MLEVEKEVGEQGRGLGSGPDGVLRRNEWKMGCRRRGGGVN
jgi:hypothetical protein